MAKRHQNPRSVPTRRERDERPADFELIFDETGRVQLKDAEHNLVWSSDNDDDFAEDFDSDFFDSDDADDILDYLTDNEYVTDDDEIDIMEIDLEESDDDRPLHGELIPARRRT